MIPYFVAIILSIILCKHKSSAYALSNGKYAQRFLTFRSAFFVLLPLTFLAVFRWDLGVDCVYGYNYWDSFQKAASMDNLREFEIGFFALTVFLSKIGMSYWGYLSVITIIFMACISYALYKGSVWTTWSLLVFFLLIIYFDSFNTIRQTLAESISLIAWANMGSVSASERRDSRNIGLFLLASTMHTVALINIPIYFICKLRFDRKNLFVFMVTAVIATPMLQIILRTIMQYVAGDRYTFMGIAIINTVMTGLFFFCSWYVYDDICAINQFSYRYVNLALCIFILILNSGALLLPFRIFDMMKVAYLIIIPYIMKSIRSEKVRFIMGGILLCILCAWFFNAFFIQRNTYVPYESVFTDFITRITLP